MDRPVFARPPCVISVDSQKELGFLLSKYKVPYLEWKRSSQVKLWNEVEEGDATFTYRTGGVLRCIIAIAMRVVMYHPRLGILVLVEFVQGEDGLYKPRRHINSSLSEKVICDRTTGIPLEEPGQTIIRCLEQETGTQIDPEEVNDRTLTFMPKVPSSDAILGAGFGHDAVNVELEFGFSDKYPKLPTLRQIANYKLVVSPRHYHAGYYVDESTKYVSFWRSVHRPRIIEPFMLDTVPQN